MDDPNRRGYHPEEAPFYLGGGKVDAPPPPPRSPYRRLVVVFASILGVMLVIMVIMAAVLVHMAAAPQSGSGFAIHSTSTVATPTTAHQQPTPTFAVPTNTPTSTPTPCPKPCTVYQENGSDGWQGWTISDPWKAISSGSLVFPADTGKQAFALAPVDLTGVQNFDIVASMRFPVGYDAAGGFFDGFGEIVACYSGQTSYMGGIHFDNWSNAVYASLQLPNDKQDSSFQPGSDWHTYRLAVRGYNASLFIDGSTVAIAQKSDSQYTICGNQVGLWSSFLNMEVKSFQAIEV